MLGLEFVLIPALGGYLFLSRSNKHKAEISRLSGYHVLFKSATRGLVVLFLTQILVEGVGLRFYPKLFTTWQEFVPNYFSISPTLAVVFCFLHACYANIWITEQRGEIETAKENGDLIEILIHECIDKKMMMEVTLKNRKIYIGTPLETGFKRTHDHDIWIVPFASGYRDESNLELKITTKYANYTKRSNKMGLVYRDFKVAIPIQEITSARLFDKNVYQAFRRDKILNRRTDVI